MTVKIIIDDDYYEGYFYRVYDPKENYDTDQEIAYYKSKNMFHEISKDKYDEFVKIEKAYLKMKEELEAMHGE